MVYDNQHYATIELNFKKVKLSWTQYKIKKSWHHNIYIKNTIFIKRLLIMAKKQLHSVSE